MILAEHESIHGELADLKEEEQQRLVALGVPYVPPATARNSGESLDRLA